MKRETFEILVEKYLQGTASNAEQQELYKFYDALQRNQLSWDEVELGNQETAKHRLYTNILQEIAERESGSPKQSRNKLWTKVAVAAAILFVLGSGLFFYNRYANTLRHLEESASTRDLLANDIKPGSNKAILTLADGSTITLDNAANGTVAKQSGVQITKTANGQLIYEASSSNNSSLPSGISPQGGERGMTLNTISTPRGGQYQVRLPDGSKVWLNAASKLTYPVSFNGRESRQVKLSGEAYFEVAKDKQHPFIVKSNGQEVQVLGTHFNINSYADEAHVRTTLVEGKVKVMAGRQHAILNPGEEAIFTDNKFKISHPDIEQTLAWKNGYFDFSEDLQSVMRKLERWYDIEVIYEIDHRESIHFEGNISRSKNISAILKIMESTQRVHFKVEGRRVTVMK